MSEFQHYPKQMIHPRAQAATTSGPVRDAQGHIIGQEPPGKPATFPPVVVNNKDQELDYASRGYVPQGNPDPSAYMKSVLGADEPNDYKFAEYPKYLYQSVDGKLENKLVKSEAEASKLGDSWHKTPALAVENDIPAKVESSKPVEKQEAKSEDKQEKPVKAKAKPGPKKKPIIHPVSVDASPEKLPTPEIPAVAQ